MQSGVKLSGRSLGLGREAQVVGGIETRIREAEEANAVSSRAGMAIDPLRSTRRLPGRQATIVDSIPTSQGPPSSKSGVFGPNCERT